LLSQLSSKYDDLNGKWTAYRNRVIRYFVLILGGVALLEFSVYYYPTSYALRTVLVVAAAIMAVSGLLLFVRLKDERNHDQRLFMRTYVATSELKEYVMHSTKVKARKQAEKHLRSLSRLIEIQWELQFTLAKEVLGPVETFVTDLRDKILYSVEKGTYDHVNNALSFVEQFALFLLKEHPTINDLPTAGRLVLLERPPPKKPIMGRGMAWIMTRPSLKGIVAYSVAGVIAGVLAFEIARSVGADVNYAWASAVAVFLALFGYGWKKA